jgi:hypothetical protein
VVLAGGYFDNKFNGEIDWVQIDLGADSHDHLINRLGHLSPLTELGA